MKFAARTFSLMLIALIALSSASVLGGQYDDVAVIVNTNSTTSIAIGDYYRAARGIPEVNMIYISSPVQEEIDSTTFEALRSQVENYLITNNLVNTINYLVTTKGVPLKVNRGNTFSTGSPSSSVESELACILGSYSQFIGKPGRVTSPYHLKNVHFSRSAYSIYLVTRLDGYTVQDVQSLIDRSGPGMQVDQACPFLLDQDPDYQGTSYQYLNTNLARARDTLASKGRSAQLNSDTTYVTNRSNVVGYMSWGSNDHHASEFTQNGIPHHVWAPGAIAETYVSTSARSFEEPPVYGQSLIADLIREGASGAKGYVYEPYSSSMAVAYILFDRYASGYTLAESYYMASCYISWMDVVVGDPKTSISFGQGALPIQLQYLLAQVNPNSNTVELSWGTLSELNNYGFVVQRSGSGVNDFADLPNSMVIGHGTTLQPQTYAWTDASVRPGRYDYRLRQIDLDGTQHFTEPCQVDVPGSGSSADATTPAECMLAQNYPNPFNPSTSIRYTTTVTGRVVLKVYTQIGQEVATLADEIQPAGQHTVRFVGGDLASGVYYCRLEAENQVQMKRMVFVK